MRDDARGLADGCVPNNVAFVRVAAHGGDTVMHKRAHEKAALCPPRSRRGEYGVGARAVMTIMKKGYALPLQPSTFTILWRTMERMPSRASVRYWRGSK